MRTVSYSRDTLHDVLAALGYRHEAAQHGERHVVRVVDGERVYTGTAGAVWEWLRSTGQIATSEEG